MSIHGHYYWNPSIVKWRFETHCYGPQGCPRYKTGHSTAYQAAGLEWCMSMMMWNERRAGNETDSPNVRLQDPTLIMLPSSTKIHP